MLSKQVTGNFEDGVGMGSTRRVIGGYSASYSFSKEGQGGSAPWHSRRDWEKPYFAWKGWKHDVYGLIEASHKTQ